MPLLPAMGTYKIKEKLDAMGQAKRLLGRKEEIDWSSLTWEK
jgi:hypothetical protein